MPCVMFYNNLLYLYISAQHIRLHYVSAVLYTIVRYDQHVTNSFKLANTVTVIQNSISQIKYKITNVQ